MDDNRIIASWISPRKRYNVPHAINSNNIGSWTTSRMTPKIFFFFAEGSSLYPSLAILSLTSLVESHCNFLTSASVIRDIKKTIK